MALNCGHVFCQFCIKQWEWRVKTKKDFTCPNCRVLITAQNQSKHIENLISAIYRDIDETLSKEREDLIKERKLEMEKAVKPDPKKAKKGQNVRQWAQNVPAMTATHGLGSGPAIATTSGTRNTNAQGSVGPRGPIGPRAPVGPRGPIGPRAPVGPQAQRPVRPQGRYGPDIVSQYCLDLANPQRPVGPQGPQRPVEPQGPQRPIGPQGPVGAQGSAGPGPPLVDLTSPQRSAGPQRIVVQVFQRPVEPLRPAGPQPGSRAPIIPRLTGPQRPASGPLRPVGPQPGSRAPIMPRLTGAQRPTGPTRPVGPRPVGTLVLSGSERPVGPVRPPTSATAPSTLYVNSNGMPDFR